MPMFPTLTRPRAVVAAALLGAALSSQAAFSTAYTTEASFLAVVTGAATDSFDDLTPSLYASPLTRSAGAFSYQAQAASGLFGAGSAADAWLSTSDRTEALVLTAFAPTLRAVGGYFFASDIDGAGLANRQVTVTVTDNALATHTEVFSTATTGTFFGITSTNAIVSLSIATDATIENWPTVNNLLLAAPVPEPGALALLLVGLAAVAGRVRARQSC